MEGSGNNVVMVIAVITVAGSLIAVILLAVTDPRIRFS